jgi:hypothetical protein
MQSKREIEIRTVVAGVHNEKRRVCFLKRVLLKVSHSSKTLTLNYQVVERVDLLHKISFFELSVTEL